MKGSVTVHKVNQLSRRNLKGEKENCCVLSSTPQRPLKYTYHLKCNLCFLWKAYNHNLEACLVFMVATVEPHKTASRKPKISSDYIFLAVSYTWASNQFCLINSIFNHVKLWWTIKSNPVSWYLWCLTQIDSSLRLVECSYDNAEDIKAWKPLFQDAFWVIYVHHQLFQNKDKYFSDHFHWNHRCVAQRLWSQTPALKGWVVPEGAGRGYGGCMWCERGGASI